MGTEPKSREADARIETATALLDEHSTMAIAMTIDGEPWAGRVFFVHDEPDGGALDICCVMLLTDRKADLVRRDPRVAFVVGGDRADRWLSGSGRAELIEDDADARAIEKRLAEKGVAAAAFLERTPGTPVRIHVERMRLTDLTTDPPIAEFSFAAG